MSQGPADAAIHYYIVDARTCWPPAAVATTAQREDAADAAPAAAAAAPVPLFRVGRGPTRLCAPRRRRRAGAMPGSVLCGGLLRGIHTAVVGGWQGLLSAAAWAGRSLAAAGACALAPATAAFGALAAAAAELAARTGGSCGGAGSWRGGRAACSPSRIVPCNISLHFQQGGLQAAGASQGSRHLRVCSVRACGAEARALALQDLGRRHSFLDCARPNTLTLTVDISKAICDTTLAGRTGVGRPALPVLLLALSLRRSAPWCCLAMLVAPVAPALTARDRVRRRAHGAWSSRSQELDLLLCEPRPDVTLVYITRCLEFARRLVMPCALISLESVSPTGISRCKCSVAVCCHRPAA